MHNSFHMQDSTPKFVYCNKKKKPFISSKLKSFGLKVFFAEGSELYLGIYYLCKEKLSLVHRKYPSCEYSSIY